jgi:hypothetical protein
LNLNGQTCSCEITVEMTQILEHIPHQIRDRGGVFSIQKLHSSTYIDF